MKFFITGATGFIGSWVVDILLSRFPDAQITCLVRANSNLQWLKGKPVQLYTANLLDTSQLKGAVGNADYILHIAGVVKALKPQDFYEGNVRSCEVLYQAVHRWGKAVRQIVHLSSQAVVGPSPGPQPLTEDAPSNPITDYGKSKWQGEQVALQWMDRLPITILRPTAVYGPRDREIFRVFQNVWLGWNVKLGAVDPLVSLVYVADLAEAIVLAAINTAAAGQTYFVCNDQPYFWSTVVETLAQVMNRKVRTVAVPFPIAYLVASGMEFWGFIRRRATMLSRQKMVELAQPFWVVSNAKIKKELHFEPRTALEDGIRSTFDWYRQQGWLK